MKKSLIALLVVLALVVSVSVFTVSADPVYASDLTVAADAKTATGYCPHCDKEVTWEVWNGTTHRRTNSTNGNGAQQHLFLADNVANGGPQVIAHGVHVDFRVRKL